MNPVDGDAQRVAAMVIRNQETLLRVAQSVSLCADDAHDAVQRALEIYLRRLHLVDLRTELAWLKVVVRNEALTVRKLRSTQVTSEDVDLDAQPSPSRDPHDHALGAERVARSAEALSHLKHDEARALIARSMGLSYREIAQRFSWSYTKTNRAITEGRARFRRLYEDIEGGRECERHAPAVAAVAGGEPTAEQTADLRAHLRSCVSCRAAVRAARGRVLTRAAAVFGLPVKWIADRLGQAKAEAYAWSARAGEIAATAPIGGGRATAATALVGVCLGGVGAGGYCVTRDLLDAPRRPPAAHRADVSQPERAARPPAPRGRARVEQPVLVAAVPPERQGSQPSAVVPEASRPQPRPHSDVAPAEFEVVTPRAPTGRPTEFAAPTAVTAGEFSSVE